MMRLIDDVWNELITYSRSSISFIEFVCMIIDGICWSKSLITIILRLLRSSIEESIVIHVQFLIFFERTPILILLLLHVQPQGRLTTSLIHISIWIPVINPTGIDILIIRPIGNIKWPSSFSLIEPIVQRTRYHSVIKHNTF